MPQRYILRGYCFVAEVTFKKTPHVSRLTGTPCKTIQMQLSHQTLLYFFWPRYVAGLDMFEGCKIVLFEPISAKCYISYRNQSFDLQCTGFYMKHYVEMG